MLQTLTVLASVYDKTGLLELVGQLRERFRVQLISTGGTAKYLQQAGFKVIEVAKLTRFPEILDGRVKTLHPRIFGGILAEKDNSRHRRELRHHKIEPINMVIVNLYPFAQTIKQPEVSLAQAIEQIDIGGVALLRAAAKSFRTTVVVSQIKDYGKVTQKLSLKQRRQLAVKAFQLTSKYDRLIAKYLKYGR